MVSAVVDFQQIKLKQKILLMIHKKLKRKKRRNNGERRGIGDKASGQQKEIYLS